MATSISLLKPGLKTAIVESLYNEILTNTNNYYYFLGRPLLWSGANDSVTAPQVSLDYEALTRDGMVFLKKITSTDISFTIPRYDWESGTVFDKYDTAVGRSTVVPNCSINSDVTYLVYPSELDIATVAIGDLVINTNVAVGATITSIDTVNRRINLSLPNVGAGDNATVTFTTVSTLGATSLEESKFYCITSDNNVYKCIDNNKGAPSTIKPYGISYDVIATEDGYVWKYMYTIPTALANKFSTLTDIPVTTAIKNQFYSKGTIASTTIISPGSGYRPGDYLIVSGDGHLRDNVFRILGFNVDDQGYGYDVEPTVTVDDPYVATAFEGAVDHLFTMAALGGDVDVSTDTITITNHGLITGSILYYNNGGNTSIGGLVNLKGYYVIVVDSNTIKLATTADNAAGGVAINLAISDNDVYGTHTLTRQSGVYLIGQYVKVEDRIYQVTTSGTFSSVAPTHTSTEPVYNGTAALKFVGLTVQPSVNIVDTRIDSVDLIGIIGYVTIQDPGAGYSADNPPNISIDGDGSSAAAYASVVSGRVVDAFIANRGTDYSNATVTIDPPVSTATASAAVVGNVITGITVTYSGSGYDASIPPAITITGGGGSGAAASAVVINGRVVSITVTNAGSGYTSTPSVSVQPPPNAATATATISGGIITNVTILNAGNGYDELNPPSITFTGGSGTGASASAVVVDGKIAEINIINPGLGYLTAPTITIDSPGIQATAVAEIYYGYGYSRTPLITVSDPKTANYNWSAGGVVSLLDIVQYNRSFYEVVQFATPRVTFNGSSGSVVNLTNDTITIPSHSFTTGDAVLYNNGGGTSIGGLASGTTYYVVKIDNNTIKLASSYANATATAVTTINLTAGAVGTSHYLQAKNFSVLPPVSTAEPIKFNPTTAVNLTNNTITIPEHGLSTGEPVVYDNRGGTSIGNLNDNAVYHVILVDGDTIKLASSTSNATSGVAVDLTTGAIGSMHSVQRVEVNGDLYIKYIARTATITPILQKTQAKVAPVIENGQIVGVIIIDGGIGYTTATITAFGAGSGAEIMPDISIGDLNTNQANVELLAVNGSINKIEVTYPGSGYSWAKVDIIGDGQGATASAVLNSGSIQEIVVTNTGRGYSKAYINIVGNNTADQAYARAIISPIGGHGKNAVRELFAKDITLSSTIAKNKNQGFDVDNDYRQLGIIKNPTEFSSMRRLAAFTGSTCYVITGDFNYDEIENDTILVDVNASTIKEVVVNNGGSNYVSPTITFGDPTIQGGRVATGTVNVDGDGVITSITITDRGSGYTSSPTITIDDVSGSGFQGTATVFLKNRFLVVSKPSINPGTNTISLLVQPLDNATITAGQKLYVESIHSSTERTVTLVTPPTVNKYSGDMLYIDNRNAFIPSDEQTISIKTAIRL